MLVLKLICVVFCIIKIAKTCNFDFKTDFPKNAPLIFDFTNDKLVIPIKNDSFKGVQLNVGDQIFLSCAGKNNSFQDTNKTNRTSTLYLTCSPNNILTSRDQKNYTLQNLGCRNKTESMIILTGKTCANEKAKLLEIGFNNTQIPTNFWFPIITTCYDANTSRTYYSSHTLSGKGVAASQTLKRKPYFIVGLKKELYSDYSPNKAYKDQRNTLAKILGSKSLAQKIFNKGHFISRGHLSPNADFFYDATRSATYYYVNAAPQWYNINGGGWNDLEKNIRRLAVKSEKDFKIHTGTHEILTFLNSKRRQMQIYLGLDKNKKANKLPIPRFIWKIVEDADAKQGIAFVSYNNKTIGSANFTWPCGDVCAGNNWTVSSSNDKGMIICCEVNDLRSAIPDLPEMDVSGGVLQGFEPKEAEEVAHVNDLIFSSLGPQSSAPANSSGVNGLNVQPDQLQPSAGFVVQTNSSAT